MAIQPGPLLRALLPQLVPPPPAGSRHHLGAGPMHVDVCGVCHGAATPGTEVCATCHQCQTEVTNPVGLIVPISLYRAPSNLDTLFYLYKTTLRRPGDPAAKQALWQLAAILACFLDAHCSCIEGAGRGGWDAITTVPPTRTTTRTGSQHPLAEVIRLLTEVHLPTRHGPRQWASEHLDVLTPGPAVARLGERHAADDGFLVPQPQRLQGRRLLLVDDLLVSGAHLQSAASALSSAGAHVIAAVVIGRRLNIRQDYPRRLWDQLHREQADRRSQPARPGAVTAGGEQRQPLAYFDACCLEEQGPRQVSLL